MFLLVQFFFLLIPLFILVWFVNQIRDARAELKQVLARLAVIEARLDQRGTSG